MLRMLHRISLLNLNAYGWDCLNLMIFFSGFSISIDILCSGISDLYRPKFSDDLNHSFPNGWLSCMWAICLIVCIAICVGVIVMPRTRIMIKLCTYVGRAYFHALVIT